MINSLESNIQKYRLNDLETLLNNFEDSVADEVNKNRYVEGKDYNTILIHIAGKTTWTFREIIYLCSCGFPEGALSLARNLYEQAITLAFLTKVRHNPDFQNYIDDYFEDANIQRTKVFLWEAKFITKDNQKVQKYERELQMIRSNAHHNGKGDYWWTGYGNFTSVVEYLISTDADESFARFMTGLHLIYKRACASLHAGSFGNGLRLGTNPSFVGVDNTAKAKGQELPLYFATNSFIPVVGVTCRELNLGGDELLKSLNDLAIFYFEKQNNEE